MRRYLTLAAELEWDEDATAPDGTRGAWGAAVVCLPGCASQGKTPNEARKLLTEALDDVLANYAERGEDPPYEVPEETPDLASIVFISVSDPRDA